MLASHDFPTDQHGWAELLPKRQAQKSLIGSHRTPWVVVGAGFTGLACARRLAELHPDSEILLLEARQVGQGSSGRNSGFAVSTSHFGGGFSLDDIHKQRQINRINQAGLALLHAQVQKHNIDCQWSQAGFHHVAADQLAMAECDTFRHCLETMEIDYTLLDQQALADRLGTTLYRTGVHVPGGVLLQPATLVRGLTNALPQNVSLYEESPVLRIEQGAPITLHLANGEIKTDKLILATNYEAAKLGFLQRRLMGSTLTGSLTRVLTDAEFSSMGNLTDWGVLSLHGGGATVRLTPDRRIMIRNTAEYHHGDLLSDTQLAQRHSIHRTAFDKRFPQLADVAFEYSWSGVEGISRNYTTFFGAQSKNVYFAGGYNGSGVTRGYAFGTALGEYASGEQSALIKDCLTSAPAGWIPPRPLLDIGAFFKIRSRFKGVGLDR